jgi:hypothetical protein
MIREMDASTEWVIFWLLMVVYSTRKSVGREASLNDVMRRKCGNISASQDINRLGSVEDVRPLSQVKECKRSMLCVPLHDSKLLGKYHRNPCRINSCTILLRVAQLVWRHYLMM